MAHTITVGAPRRMTELEIGVPENDCSISGDGLTLYYAVGTGAALDLHAATRTTLAAPWVPAGRVDALDTASQETRFSVNGDGLWGVLSSDRSGNADLWLTERSSTSAPFGAPTRMPVMSLDTTRPEYDPELSTDGLRIYYGPELADGRQHLQVARRAQLGDAFVIERTLDELDPGVTFSDPAISPDELVIAFAAMVPARLFYATRTDREGTFGAAIEIPNVGSPPNVDTELSPDGCELYFTSNRSGAKQLYVARVQ